MHEEKYSVTQYMSIYNFKKAEELSQYTLDVTLQTLLAITD